MKILNTITAIQSDPKGSDTYENTYHVTRPYKLTSTGAERILNSAKFWQKQGIDGPPTERIRVSRVESAIHN